MRNLVQVWVLLCLGAIGCQKPISIPLTVTEGSQGTTPTVTLEALPRGLYPLSESYFSGEYYFLRSVVAVKTPGEKHADLAPGAYSEKDHLVKFERKNKTLNLVSVVPRFDQKTGKELSNVVASFSGDNEQTIEGFVFDPTTDTKAELAAESTNPADLTSYRSDSKTGALSFSVYRLLKDGTEVEEKYSLLRKTERDFKPIPYPDSLQKRFGFFYAESAQRVKSRLVKSGIKRLVAHHHPARKLVFHFSAGFPEKLKPELRSAAEKWNSIFAKKDFLGHAFIEIKDNTGQALGDLSTNIIHYDPHTLAAHELLGYAPRSLDPVTGEIIKTDIILYGANIERALFKTPIWQAYLQGESVPRDSAPISPILAPDSTHLTLPFLTSLHLAVTNSNEGEEALLKKLVLSTSLHEMGHSLGLKHNFKASFDPHSDTATSVMDYTPHGTFQDASPGEYDEQALKFGYLNQIPGEQDPLYYFCSDEDLYSAADGACLAHDRGKTLTDIADHQAILYYASFALRNLRLDNVAFDDNAHYEREVREFLMPLRVIHDHSVALVHANESKKLTSFWRLARERVEADSDSTDVASVEISHGESVTIDGLVSQGTGSESKTIDLEKADAVSKDAERAIRRVFDIFFELLTDDSRANADLRDSFGNTLLRKGVLPDRLIALDILSAINKDPFEPKQISFYDRLTRASFDQLLSDIFVDGGEITLPTGPKLNRPSFPAPMRDKVQQILKAHRQAGIVDAKDLSNMHLVAGKAPANENGFISVQIDRHHYLEAQAHPIGLPVRSASSLLLQKKVIPAREALDSLVMTKSDVQAEIEAILEKPASEEGESQLRTLEMRHMELAEQIESARQTLHSELDRAKALAN